jgi:hypothetical protein
MNPWRKPEYEALYNTNKKLYDIADTAYKGIETIIRRADKVLAWTIDQNTDKQGILIDVENLRELMSNITNQLVTISEDGVATLQSQLPLEGLPKYYKQLFSWFREKGSLVEAISVNLFPTISLFIQRVVLEMNGRSTHSCVPRSRTKICLGIGRKRNGDPSYEAFQYVDCVKGRVSVGGKCSL